MRLRTVERELAALDAEGLEAQRLKDAMLERHRAATRRRDARRDVLAARRETKLRRRRWPLIGRLFG